MNRVKRRHGLPHVSVRGTLAHEFLRHMGTAHDPEQAIETFLGDLLSSREGDVVRYVDGDTLVVGLKSERGLFPPDW